MEDIIKAFDDSSLHLIYCCCTPCHMKTKLCHTSILFNKVKFTVIFWVKITYMSMRFYQLLKLGILRDKIGLEKKYTPATAVSTARWTVKTWALCKKIQVSLGPQTTLLNDCFYVLKLARHGGVVFGVIKHLWFAIWKCAAMHAWAIRMVCLLFLWSCERSQ